MNVRDASVFCGMPQTWTYQTLRRIDPDYRVRQQDGITEDMLSKLYEWRIRSTGIDRFPFGTFAKKERMEALLRHSFSSFLRAGVDDVALAELVIAYKVIKGHPIANILTFVSRYRPNIPEYRCWFASYVRKLYTDGLISGLIAMPQNKYSDGVKNYLKTIDF